MRKLLTGIMMLMAGAVYAQPTGYVPYTSKVQYVAAKMDSGLHVPRYAGTPTLRSKVWNGAGLVAVDTVNNKFYFYSGGAWREAGSTNYADSLRRVGLAVQMRKGGVWTNQFDLPDSIPPTPTLQQVLTAGNSLTYDNHIIGQNRYLYLDSLYSFQIKTSFLPSTGRSYAQFNQNGIFLSHATTGTTGSGLTLQKGRILMNATNSAIDFYPEIGSYTTYISDGGSKISYFKMFKDSIYYATDKLVINLPSKGAGKVLTSDANGGASWQTPATVADTSYTTLASFTAGAGFASDTTMCTDSTLFGSFYTGQFDYTIAYVQAVIKGNAGDSIVLKLVYNDTFNVDGTKVNGAGLSVNNRYTGNTFTISTNRVVAANTWLWLKPEAIITGKKPKYISVTLVGYKTYVAP